MEGPATVAGRFFTGGTQKRRWGRQELRGRAGVLRDAADECVDLFLFVRALAAAAGMFCSCIRRRRKNAYQRLGG